MSRTKECHGEFQIKSKRGRYNYYHYHSNRTKTNTYIEMTIDHAPHNCKSNILIVDDHPFIIQGYKNAITRYNPKNHEFFITEAKIVSQHIM
jgi:hypothetical protein